MNIEQTTELYAAVLRQLLPAGGYDTSPNTVTAKDIYAHAKLFAQADMDAKRILSVLETIPPELIVEYENAHGMPLKCSTNVSRTFEERLEILNWVRNTKNVLNRAYLTQLLKIFGVILVELKTYRPLQCTAPCTSAINTEQLRYKVLLRLEYPAAADIECIIENYLPSYLRVDWIVEPEAIVISCDGAINSVMYFDAVLPNTNAPEGTTYIKVDGILLSDDVGRPDWLELQFLPYPPDSSEIPEGFVADGDTGNLRKFINTDKQPHRIELGSINPGLSRPILYGNDTVIQRTEIKGEDSGVCLAPSLVNFSAPYDVTYIVEEIKAGHVALFKVDPMQKYKLKINGEYVTRLDGSTEFENIHLPNMSGDSFFNRASEHFVPQGIYVIGIHMPNGGPPFAAKEPSIMFGIIQPCKTFTFELEGAGIETYPQHEQNVLSFFRGSFSNPNAEMTPFQVTEQGVKFSMKSLIEEPTTQISALADTDDIHNIQITYASNEWSDGEEVAVHIFGRTNKSDGFSTDYQDFYASYDLTVSDAANRGFGKLSFDISDVNFQSKNFHTTTDGDTVNNYVLLTAEIETARTGNIVEDVSLMIDIGLMEESEPMLSNGIVTYSIATANVFKNMAMMVNFSNTGTGEDIALLEPQDKKYTYSQIGRQMKISVDLNGVQRNPYYAPITLYLPAEPIETSQKIGIATTLVEH